MIPMNTKLSSKINFKVWDRRGEGGFPFNKKGLVYVYDDKVKITCRWTHITREKNFRYVIRTDNTNQGWRVDLIPSVGPSETVYGADRQSYWDTPQEAAQALEAVIRDIETNSTIITFGGY